MPNILVAILLIHRNPEVKKNSWEGSREARFRRGWDASAPATAAGKLSIARNFGMPSKDSQADFRLVLAHMYGGGPCPGLR